jgi:hypothetical protein
MLISREWKERKKNGDTIRGWLYGGIYKRQRTATENINNWE